MDRPTTPRECRAMATVIVALDVESRGTALEIVETLGDGQHWYKVGLELFTREGSEVVESLADAGKSVLLDLKLHDIPATVARTTAAAADLGAKMLTLHVTGGKAMVQTASDAAEDRILLLGVTVLTSFALEDIEAVRGCEITSVRNEVQRLTNLATEWGLGGVVTSALEASWIKRRVGGDGLTVVTPGIRMPGQPSDDQRRVASPAAAVRAGADYLVVGRPVTRASDPPAALARILADVRDADEKKERKKEG